MQRKRQAPQQEGNEEYPKSWRRPGDDLRAGGERFRRRGLQEAHLLGLGQLLIPDLGLDPTADDGAVGIGRLGLLGGGAGGGAGRGGAPLPHEFGAQRKLRKWRGRRRQLLRSARRKTVAAEWEALLPLLLHFIRKLLLI
jgi:hypothetical protein